MVRTSLVFARGVVAGLVLMAASPQPVAASTAIEARLPDLKAGDYVWKPELATQGPLQIVISLGLQRAYVFRGDTLIGASTVSSGRAGHESPVGRFQILQKARFHRSNRYNDAPMPFMQRLNWYGVALHGGEVPNRPASHGCVRLPMAFAQKLYAATEVGSAVYITDDDVTSPRAALNLARGWANAPMPRDRMPRGAAS